MKQDDLDDNLKDIDLQDEETQVVEEEQTASSTPAGDSLEERVKVLEDQLKRAVADYHNLEKRISEGRSELSSWANSELIKKLLPVLDHLDKALSGMSKEELNSGWAKGVAMSVKMLKEILKQEGLEETETLGQFDPLLHEAVDSREGEHDKVLEIVETGYKLHGKILRPARVVVGRESN
jgi:molecular chaperone GrpE